MKLKFTTKPNGYIDVINADTGEKIEGVISATIQCNTLRGCYATIEIASPEINIVADRIEGNPLIYNNVMEHCVPLTTFIDLPQRVIDVCKDWRIKDVVFKKEDKDHPQEVVSEAAKAFRDGANKWTSEFKVKYPLPKIDSEPDQHPKNKEEKRTSWRDLPKML